ncbi:MAG TPA: N-acetylmuramoyl-L-alanine amidase [Gemmatimonadota bacterium]|nr:N-acetylmuramoyl-L-alanine amidase [Gemmatimonadota bacterium]
MARAIIPTVFAAVLAGCAAPAHEMAGPPPIPPRRGALAIDVVYPRDSALISARDSNFIFGSVGNGDARLTINGRAIPVEPNGAFLAWIPVPAAAGDTLTSYELVASLGGREVRKSHSVRLPRVPGTLPADSLVVEPSSVTPQGAWWVAPGELVPVSVRASPGARVRLLLPDGGAVELAEQTAEPGGSAANWIFGRVPTAGLSTAAGLYRGEWVAGQALGRGVLSPRLPPVSADLSGVAAHCAPPQISGVAAAEQRDTAAVVAEDSVSSDSMPAVPAECAVLEVVLVDDTVWTPLPLDLWVMDGRGDRVELREEPSSSGRDGFVTGRASPGATTLWLWSDGVQARPTGRRDGEVRLALDGRTEAWVALDELVRLPESREPERTRVGTVRLEGRPDRVVVRIDVSDPVPYFVSESDGRLSLILYGAYSDTDWLRYGPADDFVRSASWEQAGSDRYVLHLELAGRLWGYRARYGQGGLTLEIRKPPPLDIRRPLEGLKVAVDPGHPPGGSTGPTRLREGDANLAVAFRLKRLLEEEGAQVILMRADRGSVRLYDRTQLAELLDAHVLVSIHNNALPDGVNPFQSHGTSVYYFHPQSLDLAQALQRSLLRAMGLVDLGIGRASLALARPTWMPAVLTEGAFMMIPAQEAGLKGPAFQEAYARGVLEGLRAFVLGRID